MSITPRDRKKLEERDPYCLHCGWDTDLVIHHRKNRGMGGSKRLDHPANLLRVCEDYNFKMESSSTIAEEARGFGHKLESWRDTSDPVFDACNGIWYVLNDNFTKTAVDEPEGIF